ncbi:MAG: DUF2937 family protein [Pseudomonadota bacterium]|nr:DUF2937 family protein [Pseudomonadota bacterium]
MKLITGVLDRLLFALGLVMFLQLPQFIDHYTQRLGGYRQAVADSVADYQLSADTHYAGDLNQLVADFRNDDKPAQRDMGDKIQRDRDRLVELNAAIAVLSGDSLIDKLIYLARNLDLPLAEATAEAFTPGVPLNLQAGLCGLVGGLLMSGLFNLLIWPVRRAFRYQRMPAH